MANLKEIRTRSQSVSSIMQITNAMKMVSAAKLKKAQDAIIQMRPYANKLKEIMENLSANIGSDAEGAFSHEREKSNVLLVIITSNKGLCGAFNSNVIKKASDLAEEKYKTPFLDKKVDFIAIGKKGYDQLRSKKYNVVASHTDIFNDLTFENVVPIADEIMQNFVNKKYDVVELVYNQFKNAAVQVLKEEQFLPIQKPEIKEADRFEIHTDFIYEPSQENIIRELIPKSLRIQFFKALLDSHASEHGARMTAMHKATDNAMELRKDLQLQYNKVRQASITNEILEIVGGAEALKG